MKNVLLVLAAALLLVGCGGGGGGGSSTITGLIVQVETGGAPNPQCTVQVGGSSVQSSATDGSFSLSVPAGTSTVTVDTHSAEGVWTFTIVPTTAGQVEDVGSLWVGASQITVAGVVQDATTNTPIAGATLSFAGRIAKSGADGSFQLTGVAYPSSNFAAFAGIVGTASASNYINNSFSAGSAAPVGGVLTLPNVLMTPLGSNTPPNTPYTIYGRITPSAVAGGTTVTLKQGGTALRITHADANGNYQIWIGPGTYTLSFANGAHTAPDANVTVTSTTDIEQVNAVLN